MIEASKPAVSRTTDSGAALSDDQVRAYRADGVLFPLNAMTRQCALEYRDKITQFERSYQDRASQILRQKSHVVLTFVYELIRLESVLDAVEALIGPDILCWSTSFFIKNPGDGKYISWHQDAPYWGLEADDIVTAWIALTPSNRSNGCMRVLPRSHHTLLAHRQQPRPDNMLTRGQEVDTQVDESLAVDIELDPGQFSLHHERMVHGSGPNRGSERRIGLAIRYIRPTAKQIVDSSDTATVVRGTDAHGHFAPEPRPLVDMAPENINFLEAILATRAGGVFRR